MPQFNKITKIFIVAGVVVIAAFDVIAALVGGPDATISWTLLQWAKQYPVVSFALGLIGGHLFWANTGAKGS